MRLLKLLRARLAPRAALPILVLAFAACTEEPGVTGSANATVLTGATFTVTERTISGGKLVVKGAVKNGGKTTWYPTWIVEGDFYADSTFTFKLGGATQSFTFALEKGTSTGFDLRFGSSQFQVADYPKFAVKNLRVVQGTQQ